MMVIKKKTMKIYIYKSIFVLTFFATLFTACEDIDIVQLDPNANTVVSLSTDNIVLTEDNAESNAVTVSWTLSDFGFDAAPSYTIMIDVTGGDFSEAQLISAGSNYSYDFTVATNLGVVGSATPGGWGNPDIPDLPFYTTAMADIYVAYVTLGNGEIKFRKDNLWTENYGDSGADGTLEASGDNIAVSEGSYKITVNMANLTYTIEPFTWGLVGSATTNGWDGPDMMLTYNPFADDWRTVVTLIDGEAKFRFNNDWGLNYGDSGADGSLEIGGDNIPVSAGHYLVVFNPTTLTYSIESMDVWGLVGSATANSWDGPNQKFVPDFGINEDHYYIHGAVLSNGEIKVRQNDAWAVNYGSSSFNAASSTNDLDLGGSNIPVSAGTYNVTINFSSSTPTITLHQW